MHHCLLRPKSWNTLLLPAKFTTTNHTARPTRQNHLSPCHNPQSKTQLSSKPGHSATSKNWTRPNKSHEEVAKDCFLKQWTMSVQILSDKWKIRQGSEQQVGYNTIQEAEWSEMKLYKAKQPSHQLLPSSSSSISYNILQWCPPTHTHTPKHTTTRCLTHSCLTLWTFVSLRAQINEHLHVICRWFKWTFDRLKHTPCISVPSPLFSHVFLIHESWISFLAFEVFRHAGMTQEFAWTWPTKSLERCW